MQIIAISSGDPAGIGREVLSKGLSESVLRDDIAYVIYGDTLPALRDTLPEIVSISEITEGGKIYLIPIRDDSVKLGKPSKHSGEIAYRILKRVVNDIKEYSIPAFLTCPVSKSLIQHFDPYFIGHTEFLANEFSSDPFVMNFVSPKLNVALLTTHIPISKVASELKIETILKKLRLIYKFSRANYPYEKLALLSLNPHCGENGSIGREEKTLNEALKLLSQEGIIIEGLFPADSFFRYNVKDYRQVIAIYHDQGLIPFKMLAGETGVNVTIGLPFIRTSVDHGTAFDLAGKNLASAESFKNALKLTEEMLDKR